jgi:hypothetical protein
MVYVRLAQGWTDSTGTEHAAGAMVDVDAATLAGLESRGVVTEAGPSPSPSPSPGGDDENDGGWPVPGGGGGGGGDDDTDGGWPPPG